MITLYVWGKSRFVDYEEMKKWIEKERRKENGKEL